MQGIPVSGTRRRGTGWFLLTLAFAIHVWDEAATDFLALYNPAVQSLRAAYPALRLPVFSYAGWLLTLTVAIGLMLAATPLICRGGRWTKPAAAVYGAIMAVNGLTHLLGSIALRSFLPGVRSSPLLLAAAGFLLFSLREPRPR